MKTSPGREKQGVLKNILKKNSKKIIMIFLTWKELFV
jgi:hypothetical protein